MCPCGAPKPPGRKKCNDCHAVYMREWRRIHPLVGDQRRRANARSYAKVYLQRGKLVRQPCEDCGLEHDPEAGVLVQMHHADYDRPLDVTWLCARCHGARHDVDSVGDPR